MAWAAPAPPCEAPTSVNPAQMADANAYQADVRHARTSFDSSTRFDATFASVAIPLGRKDGLQILYGNVRSPQQASFVDAVFPGSTQKFREESLTAFYGRRVTDKLSLGIAIAPILSTNHRLDDLGAPGVGIDFAGKPITDRLKRLGGRFGADYQFASWGHASVSYDNFWERSKMTVSPVLAPAGLVNQSADFHDTALIGGVEVHPTRHLAIVVEHERAAIKGSTFGLTAHNTYLGAEWQVRRELALRLGSNNGDATYGMGFERGRFNLQAAYVNNLASKQVGPIFGKGNHLTMVEAGYEF